MIGVIRQTAIAVLFLFGSALYAQTSSDSEASLRLVFKGANSVSFPRLHVVEPGGHSSKNVAQADSSFSFGVGLPPEPLWGESIFWEVFFESFDVSMYDASHSRPRRSQAPVRSKKESPTELRGRYTHAGPALSYHANPLRVGIMAGLGYIHLSGSYLSGDDSTSRIGNLAKIDYDRPLTSYLRTIRDQYILSGRMNINSRSFALNYLMLNLDRGNNLELLGHYLLAKGLVSLTPQEWALMHLILIPSRPNQVTERVSLIEAIALYAGTRASYVNLTVLAPAVFLFLEGNFPFGGSNAFFLRGTLGGPLFSHGSTFYNLAESGRFDLGVTVETEWQRG